MEEEISVEDVDWEKILGKRILLKRNYSEGIEEAKVVEISSNGKFVKFFWGLRRGHTWEEARDNRSFDFRLVVDVLDDEVGK